VTDVQAVPYGQESIAVAAPAGGGAQPQDDYPDTDPSALTDFHTALDPYGQWVEDPNYGTVWVPSPDVVGPEFAPYETAGHWTYGDDYVWVSDYSWGWAPFHYGRWAYMTNGWGWIPGRQYAGAWVGWRAGYGAYSGYVGWAPLPPTYYWRGGYAVGIGVVPPAPYAFCRTGGLFTPGFGGGMVRGSEVGPIAQHTMPVYGGQNTGSGGNFYSGGTHGAVGGGAPGALAGRTAAHPETAGPSPQALHLGSVPAPPADNPGLLHAQQFAHPSSALALGAHQPFRGAISSARGGSTVYGRAPSAYGSAYTGPRTTTRIGGGEGEVGHTFHSYPGVVTYRGGGGYGGAYHGGIGHGAKGVPTTTSPYHPPVEGNGYRPGSSGGHFGGHGGGGFHGGGGGGRR
jgi:hypothetical protein